MRYQDLLRMTYNSASSSRGKFLSRWTARFAMEFDALVYRNHRQYEARAVAQQYNRALHSGLTTAESYCFDRVPAASRGAILDIGIGAGRTTTVLTSQFARYVGIDYSAPLVELAKTNFPDLDLRVMDARQMAFGTEFDCVFFSFNGIDSVDSPGRELIFAEMTRVLKEGGYLIYSTHNAKHRRVHAWRTKFWVFEMFRPPRTIMARPWRFVERVWNRMNNFGKQGPADERGSFMINDPGTEFRLVTLYVDLEREIAMLKDLGYDVQEVVGSASGTPGYGDCDYWVYLLARKGPAKTTTPEASAQAPSIGS